MLELGAGGLFVQDRPAGVVQTVSANLAVDVTSVAVSPVYTPLITATLTSLLPASFLEIRFYVAASFLGTVGAAAMNIRFLLNGVLIPASRGTTENEVVARIMSLAFLRRLAIVAGPQVVLAEWTRFAGGGAGSMVCRPAALPDLEGAQLVLQEQR